MHRVLKLQSMRTWTYGRREVSVYTPILSSTLKGFHGLVKTLPRVFAGSLLLVPQIVEEIMDDMQLVPQGRVQDRIVAQLLIPPCHRSVQLVPQWRIPNILCSYSGAEGSEGRRDNGSFPMVSRAWR